jgi:hypothetical protein
MRNRQHGDPCEEIHPRGLPGLALPVFAQSTAALRSGKDTSAFDPNVRVQDDFYGG